MSPKRLMPRIPKQRKAGSHRNLKMFQFVVGKSWASYRLPRSKPERRTLFRPAAWPPRCPKTGANDDEIITVGFSLLFHGRLQQMPDYRSLGVTRRQRSARPLSSLFRHTASFYQIAPTAHPFAAVRISRPGTLFAGRITHRTGQSDSKDTKMNGSSVCASTAARLDKLVS
jgi:hypothetical protein